MSEKLLIGRGAEQKGGGFEVLLRAGQLASLKQAPPSYQAFTLVTGQQASEKTSSMRVEIL